MRKLLKSFQKRQSIASRVLCFVLVLAMVVTMVPVLGSGSSTVQAAEKEKNLTIHFMLPSDWPWSKPAIQFWDGTYAVTGNTNTESPDGTEISGWGGAKGFFMTQVDDTAEYTLSVKGTFTGFQFLDFDNTGNIKNPGYDSKLSQYTEDTPTNVYYIQKDGKWDYYLDAEGTTAVPDLPKTETTFLLVGDIPGMAWNSSAKPNFVRSIENENVYSITLNAVPAGKYQYKILEDAATEGWNKPWAQNDNNLSLNLNAPADVTLSLDKTDSTKETKVDITYIKDLVVEVPAQIQKGVTMELTATGTYYGDDGNAQNGVSVTYTAKTEGITLNGNEILVPISYEGTEVTVVAAYNGIEKEITIPVVEVVYHYTIYYYDFDETHMSENASDLWIWQKSGAGATTGTPFTSMEELSDGNEWLRADVTLPYTDVQIIPRSKDEWKWQRDTVSYNNSTKAENVTLYIVSNSNQAYTTLPELVEPRSRYVMIEYDRPANDYDGWNIYTWNSGFGSDVSVDFKDINGKMVAKIPVKDSKADLMLSFCMRHSTADNDWESKDGGDHYVTIPADQSLVKAVFTQGEGITEVLQYNAGYEMDGANDAIHFYYRNDTLAAENNLASLAGKVSVVVNGQTCPMTYDAENDRFGYNFTGVSTGDYYYYYVVDGAEKLDAFNSEKANYSGKECSVCHFKKANVSVEVSLSQYAMDYNDNNVLSVKLNAKDGEGLETSEIAAITADLSELGLSKEFAIEPELMEGTISCLNTVAAGVKNIPVTVKDIYGNVYAAATTVTVTERIKNAGDFDWDEAVIYFTVTDRFFDGDAGNNDAYGVGDYNVGEKGGSSYHGGDFSGLNQKLDYLKDLGVNTIWITPIVENITEDQHDNKTDTATYGYHGYWASDFTKLNRHLGTEQQFKALLDAAHSKGMKIMVDVVLNHAGYGTEDYFNSFLMDADGNKISMIRDDSNTISGDDKYDALSGLPDFVTENKAVTDQLVAWQTEWMSKYSIDYYRVDTVKHVESTTWAAFKNSLTKVNPDFKMIGEYSGAGYANNAGELGTGTMDALLDFDFNDFAQNFVTGNISSVENSLQKRNSAINNTATMGSFLSSHDEDTLQYKLVNESKLSEEEAYNLMKVAATLQITAKGQPVIYYGEEIGQGGANNWPLQTNRHDFDWTELEKQKADSNSIYNHYKTMLTIRNAYTDVFARGNRNTVTASDADGYEVISRSYGNSTLYVGMNVKEAEKEVVIPVAESAGTVLTNLYDGKTYTVSADQKVSVTIPAAKDGGTVVLTAKTKTEPALDDKNTDSADHNGNQQTAGNSSGQNNSANQTTPKQEEQVAAEVTVQEEDFANVIEAVNKAKTGSKIRVNLLKTTKIPANVFESIKGKDVTVTYKVSDKASWIINGKDITGNVTAPIDLGLVMGTSDIPKQKVAALADGNETIQLSLNYDGAFGFEGILRLSIGTDYSGKVANLYYYNEKTGKFEYYQAVQAKEDGTVDFEFSHASDYVIVLNDTDMSQTTSSVIASPKTSDNTPIAAAVMLLLFGCALMGTAYRKNKSL